MVFGISLLALKDGLNNISSRYARPNTWWLLLSSSKSIGVTTRRVLDHPPGRPQKRLLAVVPAFAFGVLAIGLGDCPFDGALADIVLAAGPHPALA